MYFIIKNKYKTDYNIVFSKECLENMYSIYNYVKSCIWAELKKTQACTRPFERHHQVNSIRLLSHRLDDMALDSFMKNTRFYPN